MAWARWTAYRSGPNRSQKHRESAVGARRRPPAGGGASGRLGGCSRGENRPYQGKDELVSRNVLPQATYAKIKGQIIARQSAVKK